MRITIAWILMTVTTASYAAAPDWLGGSRFSWDGLGLSYAFLLFALVLASAIYSVSRWKLILSPGTATHHYSAGIMIICLIYGTATVLENRLLGTSVTLPLEALPTIIFLAIAHYYAYEKQEPAKILFAICLLFGFLIAGVTGLQMDMFQARTGQWLAAIGGTAFLVYVMVRSVSTKWSFLRAKSIYISSKEQESDTRVPSGPALTLAHWVGLAVLCLVVAIIAQIVKGSGAGDLLFNDVIADWLTVLLLTVFVSYTAAGLYWLQNRKWLPELDRLIWVVGLLVSFGEIYGKYLAYQIAI